MRVSLRARIACSLVLAGAPFCLAHDDQGGPGTPDFTCQSIPEWKVHDYGGANGHAFADASDNNLENCGTTYGLFIAGNLECDEMEYRLGWGPGDPLWELLCNTDRPADYDGDMEFAVGGALLAVESGDGATSGSIACIGTYGHHSNAISVDDQVFGDVLFGVGADASATPPPGGVPDCGDGVIQPCDRDIPLGFPLDEVVDILDSGACNPADRRVACMNACEAPFAPGADGTYTVWVYPSPGGGGGGTPTGASHGHVSTT